MRNRLIIGIAAAVLIAAALAFHWASSHDGFQLASTPANQPSADPEPGGTAEEAAAAHRIRVAVVRPRPGGLVRSTRQPGTVEAFDFADLYAKVSGYLQRQNIDIGAAVQVGQLLAEIDNPELVQELNQASAGLAQARAQAQQFEAAILTAKADVDAAKANVEEKEADRKRASAYLAYREIQFKRISDLFQLKSIDEKLVDENHKERDAAQAAQSAAEAAIRTAKAEVAAKRAKVTQAEADLTNARAKIDVAAATLERARVFVGYLKICSPYNGVVTRRSFHVGDFIRAADQGGQTPLLTVARTDLMRVVVKMPESYVPLTDPGDPAVVELDALAGRTFHSRVARIANSEDRVDRSMRTEVDLPNTSNELRDGMFGYVTVQLSKTAKGLTIPSTSLVNHADGKTFSVDVVREGRVQSTPVKIGRDNGVQVEILGGLRLDDLVLRHPSADVSSGTAVDVEETDDRPKSAAELTH